MLVRIAKKLLPPGSLGFKVARLAARKLGIIAPAFVDGRYTDWVYSTEPLCWEPRRELTYRPLISVVVPVYNVSDALLREMVFSVVNQTYDNWELLLVNASSDTECRRYTEACAQIDTRIRIVQIAKNLGIGENTNRGIEASTGEYVALLDHDDTLARQALYEVAVQLQGKVKPEFIYSDEDKLTPKSEHRYDPHLKSDWSLHLLRQVNYLNHFTVIKKQLIDTVGAYRKGFDGAQDYDFYLRIADAKPRVAHIPKILYHWRAAPTSTAADFSTKQNILDAGIRALQGHLERNKIAGTVGSLPDQPGFYHIRYASDTSVPVAVAIMAGDSAHQYAEYIRQVVRALPDGYDDIELYVHGMQANQKYLAAHQPLLTNISAESRSEFLRGVLKCSRAKAVIVIDAAVLWKDVDWIRQLAGYVEQCPDVAAVAPLLVDKNAKKIVDAGTVLWGEDAVPLFAGYPVGAHTFFGSTLWNRAVDRLSGRVMALSRPAVERYLASDDVSAMALCKQAAADGAALIVSPQVALRFYGDLRRPVAAAPHFSPVFGLDHYEFGFPATVHFNPSGDDNA